MNQDIEASESFFAQLPLSRTSSRRSTRQALKKADYPTLVSAFNHPINMRSNLRDRYTKWPYSSTNVQVPNQTNPNFLENIYPNEINTIYSNDSFERPCIKSQGDEGFNLYSTYEPKENHWNFEEKLSKINQMDRSPGKIKTSDIKQKYMESMSEILPVPNVNFKTKLRPNRALLESNQSTLNKRLNQNESESKEDSKRKKDIGETKRKTRSGRVYGFPGKRLKKI